jgi:chemotaxis protein methyltransferase CheR
VNKDVSVKSYKDFSAFLYKECGIVLGDAKQYLVRSRLLPLLHEFTFDSVDALIAATVSKSNLKLCKAAIEVMTTNETLWFRDKYPFEILQQSVLPNFAKQNTRLTIWSAACSTGQEPYSIAMTILEYKRQHPGAFSAGVSIIGTDLSLKVLEQSQLGIYEEITLKRGLPDHYRQRYFQQCENGSFKVNDELKRLVSFKQVNLVTQKANYQSADIVFCRNVLIYFDNDEKTAILQNISACLKKGGTLFLGASESLAGAQDQFEMIKTTSGLYYSKR